MRKLSPFKAASRVRGSKETSKCGTAFIIGKTAKSWKQPWSDSWISTCRPEEFALFNWLRTRRLTAAARLAWPCGHWSNRRQRNSPGCGRPRLRALPEPREEVGSSCRLHPASCTIPAVYRFGQSRRVMNETREESKSRGKEILWSSVLWLVGGFAVYVLSYGPAVWIEPKIES